MIFIRPWFLLLLLVPLAWHFLSRRQGGVFSPWRKVIDPALLPFLLVRLPAFSARKNRARSVTLLWTLLVLALSGPAVSKWPSPASWGVPATVIAADVTPAGGPDTRRRIQTKIYDLLTALRQRKEQAALVLFDSKGYEAVPLTWDLNLIRQTVPVLAESVLPGSGVSPAAAIDTGVALLRRTGVQNGRVFLLTSGAGDWAAAERAARRSPYPVAVLLAADQGGVPVADGQGGFLKDAAGKTLLIPSDPAALAGVGPVSAKTPDAADIHFLLSATPVTAAPGSASDQTVDVWRDLGPWLLIPAAALMLLLFRGGFAVVLIGACLVGQSVQAGFWLRDDQARFQNLTAGVTAFRQRDFANAAQRFQQVPTDDGFYNAGNALAHGGDIAGAIRAYEQALHLNPAHADARFNKAYLERQSAAQNDSQKNQQKNQSNAPQTQADEKNSADSASSADQQQKNGSPAGSSSGADSSDGSPAGSSSDGANAPEGETLNGTGAAPEAQAGAGDDAQDMSAEARLSGQTPAEAADSSESETPDVAGSFSPAFEADALPGDDPGLTDSDGGLDQETRRVLNRLPQDPARLLKYRLYMQHLKQEK